MSTARQRVYEAWVELNYDDSLVADRFNILQSSVRARVSEYLNEQVPELYRLGHSVETIQRMLKCPNKQRITDRITNTPQTTSQTNHYPKRNKNQYKDILDKLPMSQLPDSITVSGDVLVTGDFQIPTTDFNFLKRLYHVALLGLNKPRKLIICGDFINADAMATYSKTIRTPQFTREIAAGRMVLRDILQIFDEIYVAQGNHEDRLPRSTDGEFTHDMLWDLMTAGDERVTVSPYNWVDIVSGDEEYTAVHGLNYSINQLRVAEQLAWKLDKHIIQHHEHHLAKGMDRYKRYIIINNGGFFEPKTMGYVSLRVTKHAGMAKGFTLVKSGVATPYGEYPFTDWFFIDQHIKNRYESFSEDIKKVI